MVKKCINNWKIFAGDDLSRFIILILVADFGIFFLSFFEMKGISTEEMITKTLSASVTASIAFVSSVGIWNFIQVNNKTNTYYLTLENRVEVFKDYYKVTYCMNLLICIAAITGNYLGVILAKVPMENCLMKLIIDYEFAVLLFGIVSLTIGLKKYFLYFSLPIFGIATGIFLAFKGKLLGTGIVMVLVLGVLALVCTYFSGRFLFRVIEKRYADL